MTEAFYLRRGGTRLLVSMPHVGQAVPPGIWARLSPVGQRLGDTDWHVDQLYGFLADLDVTVLSATYARTVVDLNRPPDGELLYPGQAETGICPLTTFDGEPLYRGDGPDETERSQRVALYWKPYHDALTAELARLESLHGGVHLLDAHSIRSQVPRLFAGTLPDLNFGTHGGASAGEALTTRVMEAAQGPFSSVLNGRFKGGYITRHYGAPALGRQAIQLELAQHAYMDEASPATFDLGRAGPLIGVLRRVVAALQTA